MVELELDVLKMPQILSPCNSRTSNASNSPEFEFCSFPQPKLHSADELFSGGVLLPLHQLHHHHFTSSDPPPPPPTPKEEEYAPQLDPNSTRTECESGSGPDISAAISHLSASGFTSSKRWKDIFKKSDKKCFSNNNDHVTYYNNNNITNNDSKEKEKEKVRKKEKRSLGIGGGGKKGVAPAELNINIWPFRRSRSAGNSGNRPRMSSTASTSRKVSSAPCSRSNSAGESKSKKWPNSPSRGGIYLGRTSPIWQLRRSGAGPGGGGQSSDGPVQCDEKATRKDIKKFPATGTVAGAGGGQKGKILKLNVPMCIGYRSNLGCRSDENSAVSVASAMAGGGGGDGGGWQSDGGGSIEGVRGSNFNIRSLFSKKVY